ncbi:hypothetical protein Ancab_033233 [Ancistrocladus abbreviatus]
MERFAAANLFTLLALLQFKASLFAAGCVSELSDDFAFVLLEMLLKMMASPETSSAVRLAAAQTFGKMWHFPSVADKSLQGGCTIVLKFSEEATLTTMLISLLKLASKSIDHSSKQNLEVLSHFDMVQILLKMLDEADASSALRCEILRVVVKILKCQLTCC